MSYDEHLARVRASVTSCPGDSEPEERRRAAAIARAVTLGESSSDELPERALIEQLVRRPIDVDPRPLLDAGATQDRLLELILSGAVSRGATILERGLRALDEAES